jgi:hypothetical protein
VETVYFVPLCGEKCDPDPKGPISLCRVLHRETLCSVRLFSGSSRINTALLPIEQRYSGFPRGLWKHVG